MARVIQFPLIRELMHWGIALTVPKQRVGVAVIALDEADRILLLRHVFHPRIPWGLPGGWLNRNEHPALGALRELKEETGLTAEISSPVLISQSESPPSIEIVYKVNLLAGEIKLSPEIIEANWFAADELPKPLTQTVSRAISLVYSSLNNDGGVASNGA